MKTLSSTFILINIPTCQRFLVVYPPYMAPPLLSPPYIDLFRFIFFRYKSRPLPPVQQGRTLPAAGSDLCDRSRANFARSRERVLRSIVPHLFMKQISWAPHRYIKGVLCPQPGAGFAIGQRRILPAACPGGFPGPGAIFAIDCFDLFFKGIFINRSRERFLRSIPKQIPSLPSMFIQLSFFPLFIFFNV